MLNINYTGTSSITLQLYDNCHNQIQPYFTFQLIRAGSLDNIIFTADDISPNPNVYNKFILTVGSVSGGLLQGIIPVQSGQYGYTVFEMPNQYDLDLNNNIGVVTVGDLNVLENPIVQIPAYTGYTQSQPPYVPSTTPIAVYRGFTVSWM